MELKAVLSASGEMTGAVGVAKGEDGKTPVKGVDYFTAAEIAEIINAALAKADTKYVAQLTGKGLSANDYTDTDKAEVAKIKDKVGFTDYATDTKTGVVKVGSIKGIKVDESGEIGLNVPNETAIAQRLPANSNLPITIGNLDYAVRSVRPEVIIVTDEPATITCSVNTIYNVDPCSYLSITLPATGQYGEFIQVDFYSGYDEATNLTITSNAGLANYDLVPEKNTCYSLYFDWGRYNTEDGYGWRFGYSEYPYEEV